MKKLDYFKIEEEFEKELRSGGVYVHHGHFSKEKSLLKVLVNSINECMTEPKKECDLISPNYSVTWTELSDYTLGNSDMLSDSEIESLVMLLSLKKVNLSKNDEMLIVVHYYKHVENGFDEFCPPCNFNTTLEGKKILDKMRRQ